MKRINLLPPEARVKASRERGLIYAVLFLVVVVVALGLVYVWQNNIVKTKEDQLAQIQAQEQVVTAQAAALAPYAQIQAQRAAMTLTGKGIYEARVPWSTILEEVSLVIPENVRLQSMTCAVPASMQPGAAAAVGDGEAAALIRGEEAPAAPATPSGASAASFSSSATLTSLGCTSPMPCASRAA